MTAPALEELLGVQELDSAIDRQQYRRQTLAERAELAAIEERAAALSRKLAGATSRLGEVAARQAEFENELAATQSRMADVNKRLYGGTVSASRELQAMAADVESLQARKLDLEEKILELMEECEPLDAEVRALEAERADSEEAREAVQDRLAAAEADIDAEVAALLEQRETGSGLVPPDLLATYERLRAKLGGVGAARFSGGSCSGCHLALSATEVDRLKHTPPEALVFCDQCGRILVR